MLAVRPNGTRPLAPPHYRCMTVKRMNRIDNAFRGRILAGSEVRVPWRAHGELDESIARVRAGPCRSCRVRLSRRPNILFIVMDDVAPTS